MVSFSLSIIILYYISIYIVATNKNVVHVKAEVVQLMSHSKSSMDVDDYEVLPTKDLLKACPFLSNHTIHCFLFAWFNTYIYRHRHNSSFDSGKAKYVCALCAAKFSN